MGGSMLGIGIQLGGSFLSMAGMNAMKYAAMFPKPETNKYLSLRFAGSLLLYASGELITAVALAFGNSAVLSACSTSGLVWNAFLANRIFGEQFTLSDTGATFAIGTGIVFCAIWGPPGHDLTPDQFKENVQHVDFVAFCAGLSVLVFICLTIVFKAPSHNHVEDGDAQPVYSSVSAVVYSALCGAIGAFTYFLASVNSQLIKHSLKDKEAPKLWQMGLFAAFIALGSAQLTFMNQALAKYEALVFVPVYYVINMLLTMFSCLVFYRDFGNLYPPVYKTALFSSGVLLILIGVRVLSLREAGSNGPALPDSEALLSPGNLHLGPDERRRTSEELERRRTDESYVNENPLPLPLQRRKTFTVTASGFSGVLLPPTSQVPSIIGSSVVERNTVLTRTTSAGALPIPVRTNSIEVGKSRSLENVSRIVG